MEVRSSTQSAGYLLGKFGLIAVGAALVLAAWSGHLVMVVLLGLVLSSAGIAWLWSRASLANVRCERSLSEKRLFPGEYIDLRLRIVNGKILPLPWVQVDDEIPLSFSSPEVPLKPGDRPGTGLLSKGTALLWYTGVSWRHRVHCRKRGYYQLGPLTVSSGDIFGFYPRSVSLPSIEHVIVYPKIFPVNRLGIPSLYPLGDTTAERRIFEDPTRTIGVRDYSPQDSLRHVHWKATARHNNLQVKVFEPTTTLKVALFLVVDSFFEQGETRNEDNFELGISTTASIASHIIHEGSQVGLFANSPLADSGQSARILPGTGTGLLVSILEALAKVTYSTSEPFEKFFRSQQKNLPWGTTAVFILSNPQGSIPGLLADLRARGHRVMVYQVGGHGPGDLEHASGWHRVRDTGIITETGGAR